MGFISLPISVIDKSYWSALLRRILRQCLRFVGQSNVIGDFPGGPELRICLLHSKLVLWDNPEG